MTVWTTWQPDRSAEILREAHNRLLGGEVLSLPSETGPLAVSAQPLGERIVVALPSPQTIFDWIPELPAVGVRLIQQYWPGPLTLWLTGGHEAGIASVLPTDWRQAIAQRGLAFRAPEADWVEPLVKQFPGPVFLSDDAPASDTITWGVDDGLGRASEPSALVKLVGRRAVVVRQGGLAPDLHDFLPAEILFVCTGNTCRSPMTKGLCEKLLADHLGCLISELPKCGFRVQSAGLAAMMGDGPSPEAVQTAGERGVDLAGHQSQPVSEALVRRADRIYTMTAAHYRWLKSALPSLPVELLAGAEDIRDPMGLGLESYQLCAVQLWDSLNARLPELLEL